MAAPQLEISRIKSRSNNSSQFYVSLSKLRPPYLKQVKSINGFHIWYVDGSYIRKNIDTEFNNYGQNHRFKFIPEREFWIDYEAKKELGYFLFHLLIEHKLMEEGKDYVTAVTTADRLEKKERQNKKEIIELLKQDKKKIIDRVHKRILLKSNQIKVWSVSGYLVRSLFNPSFTAGGHDKVYNFIPKNEVWIDNTIASTNWGFSILHELYERRLMLQNKNVKKKDNYEDSHEKAILLEQKYMKYPEGLDARIRLELKRNSQNYYSGKKMINHLLMVARNAREDLKRNKEEFWKKNKSEFDRNIKQLTSLYKFPKPWKVHVIAADFLSKSGKELMPYDKNSWCFVDIVGATRKQGFDIVVFFSKSDLQYLSLPAMTSLVVHEMRHVYQAIKNPKKYSEQTVNDELYKKFEEEAEAEIRRYPDDLRKQAVLEKIIYSYSTKGWQGAQKEAYYLYEECQYAFGDGYKREMEKEEYDLFLEAKKKKDINLFIESFIDTFDTN
jgi:hypothetical protein